MVTKTLKITLKKLLKKTFEVSVLSSGSALNNEQTRNFRDATGAAMDESGLRSWTLVGSNPKKLTTMSGKTEHVELGWVTQGSKMFTSLKFLHSQRSQDHEEGSMIVWRWFENEEDCWWLTGCTASERWKS